MHRLKSLSEVYATKGASIPSHNPATVKTVLQSYTTAFTPWLKPGVNESWLLNLTYKLTILGLGLISVGWAGQDQQTIAKCYRLLRFES